MKCIKKMFLCPTSIFDFNFWSLMMWKAKRQTLMTDAFLNSQRFMLSSVFCGSDQFLFYLAVYFNLEWTPIYILLCCTFFELAYCQWMGKGGKIFSKGFNIFLILVSVPQNNSPWCRGPDKNVLYSHMFYFLYELIVCFVLMRFGSHNFNSVSKQEVLSSPFCACLPGSAIGNLILTKHFVL